MDKIRHHLYPDRFSRHPKQVKTRAPEKNLQHARKLTDIEVISHAIASMKVRFVHKASQSRFEALSEEQSLREEFYGNDSLGG